MHLTVHSSQATFGSSFPDWHFTDIFRETFRFERGAPFLSIGVIPDSDTMTVICLNQMVSELEVLHPTSMVQ